VKQQTPMCGSHY